MSDYGQSPLWRQAFLHQDDGFNAERDMLAMEFRKFRARVSLLVAQIHKDMPSLTVHDITHIDALWWTASEITGSDYPLNPAEAFVLGGAFLLHDAAHCIAAYPGGIDEIRRLPKWKDSAARSGIAPDALIPGTEAFQLVLFDVLRAMHPKQARRLPKLHWSAPGDSTHLHLLPDQNLRDSYGDVIGQLAESHWWSPHELEAFSHRSVNPPACLNSAPWSVDFLKLAIIVRTADAAHIDAQRAPIFLLALVQPGHSSLAHWQFQSRLQNVKRDPDPARNDLFVSGSPFPANEQDAWWMAYDAARMIDKELRAADRLLQDHHRHRMAARSVASSYSPEAFSRNVPTDGWQAVDTSIKITDIKSMVERFGGEKLYGTDPAAALRELLQNAVDAVHACRKLGGLGEEEGKIEVSVERADTGYWLHVTDVGIGMSRYVLTEVLLDFGRSLWRSADLHGEWSGLSASGFEAIGQFGIGFFSIFMLGECVRVITRRYETKEGEPTQWLLEFAAGPHKRPILRTPDLHEKLNRHGTQVSVLISEEKLLELCPQKSPLTEESPPRLTIAEVCARQAPALDIDLYVATADEETRRIVKANDWQTLPPKDLLHRVAPIRFGKSMKGWSHLSELRNSTGQVQGRCAIQPQGIYTIEGIGVVKGLFAGTVQGIAGIVFVRPQNDLARKSAIPDVSLAEVRRWAEEQKTMRLKHGALDEKDSALLAQFGATHSSLTLGKLGGKSVSYEEFSQTVASMSEILVHADEVSYDDDDVLRKDFDSGFEADEILLELATSRAPAWLDKIADESISRDSWSLNAALDAVLTAAWGSIDWADEHRTIGYVDGTEIVRYCSIGSPKIEIDIDDL